MLSRPTPTSVRSSLRKGWQPNNTVFIGKPDCRRRSAVNNKVLLLTAKWYPDSDETTEYGFRTCPSRSARPLHRRVLPAPGNHWYYRIDDRPVQVTMPSPPARQLLRGKQILRRRLHGQHQGRIGQRRSVLGEAGTSEPVLLRGLSGRSIISRPIPSTHGGGSPRSPRQSRWTPAFAKSFNKRYIPDLIHRHTTALKSQFNRTVVTHNTQLDSIHVVKHPTRIVKGEEKQYAKFPIDAGKTVLIIDDVCTKGMGFEAARHYLTNRDINVVSVALLKARKNDYEALATVALPNGPFNPNAAVQFTRGKSYGYYQHIIDTKATAELTERLKRYQHWSWPKGI